MQRVQAGELLEQKKQKEIRYWRREKIRAQEVLQVGQKTHFA
jgi:hypothetical protein